MKNNLSHLPKIKQKELEEVVSAINGKTKVEMIILFWSYARWDFVDSDVYKKWHITYEYQSDYDVLVNVKNKALANNVWKWQDIETKIQRKTQTPLNIIVETIDHVNEQLEIWRYFYSDIKKEWILLYDSGKLKLTKQKELWARELRIMAQEDYNVWINQAQTSLKHYYYAIKDDDFKKWAFELHQTAENLFNALLLVFTWYRPKLHNLDKLQIHSIAINSEFKNIFKRSSEEDQKLFKLLNSAYVDARYKKDYSISIIELENLEKQVLALLDLVKKHCTEKINSF